jgi:epoxide hydrolase 4
VSERTEPAGRMIRVAPEGIDLHVVEAGPEDGPLAILLHGFPEFWYGWRRQIEPLATAGWRVLVPDQRGYHLSDKPPGVAAYALDRLADDVLGLADALGRQTFAVIGHDWGGIVAGWLASRDPRRVERAVILNAPHPATLWPYMRRHPAQLLKSWYVGLFQIPGLPERLFRAHDYRLGVRSLLAGSRRGTFTAADLDRYRAAWAQPGAVTGMINWYRALRHRRPGPRRVEAPVLLLWGEKDIFLEPGLATAAIALCEHGRLLVRPDAGHWLQHEEPGWVSAQALAFLGQSALVTG